MPMLEARFLKQFWNHGSTIIATAGSKGSVYGPAAGNINVSTLLYRL